ncbi:MAG: tetratricopeptide repeat protein [Clostridiales bacterium]|nr:tetratricopeptide repeat protein [Clostridiales bacterium]
MEFTADISKYIDAGVELAKKHPMCSTLVIVLVLFLIVTPMIGSNWLDFLKKLKDIGGQKGNFDMADLNKKQTRVIQNLALMANNRTLPFEVRNWIGCEERTLKALVKSGWLTWTERGYKVPAAVREVVLMGEMPVAAVENFLRFVANEEYFKDGEDYRAVQFKLGIIEAVLEKVEDRLEESQTTSALYTRLGSVYGEQGKYAQAEEYYQKALNIRLKALGENHPDTATSYNNLGVAYDDQGKLAQAEVCQRKALDIRLKVLGENHPSTAMSYNDLGNVYASQGKYAQAEDYYQQALDISYKVLREDHPNTAMFYSNLGCVYEEQGKYAQAEEWHRKALDIARKVLGEDHPNTAISYNNLGLVYEDQKKYNEAAELYLKAWKIRQQKLNPEHPYTKQTLNNLHTCFPHIDHGDQDFDTWLSQQ